MLLLKGVRDLGKGQTSVERTPKYPYMALMMEAGACGGGGGAGVEVYCVCITVELVSSVHTTVQL